jgi:hypothetical protein
MAFACGSKDVTLKDLNSVCDVRIRFGTSRIGSRGIIQEGMTVDGKILVDTCIFNCRVLLLISFSSGLLVRHLDIGIIFGDNSPTPARTIQRLMPLLGQRRYS